MKKVLIVYYAEMKKYYKNLYDMFTDEWKKKGVEVAYLEISDMTDENEGGDTIFPKCDYICSFDLAGFQYGTVLENGCQYNKHSSIQLHLVTNTAVFNSLRKIDTALNLFLFVPEQECDVINAKWNIANIVPYKRLEMKNGLFDKKNHLVIAKMIEYVLHEEQPDLY